MDTVSAEKRSAIMRKIKGKDTKPEIIVRKLIFSLGYRFRLHYTNLPGKPDIVFPGKKKAIFIHGCFWHQHQGCKKGSIPKSNNDYWLPKLLRNAERDKEKIEQLEGLGWKTLVIWQCELKKKDVESLILKISSFLDEGDL